MKRRRSCYIYLARAWMCSINAKTILFWEDMKKPFYLKYYPPIEAYRDQGLIYNFWPHLEESIAQAWERLKKYLVMPHLWIKVEHLC
jgi:hypothetical protein